MLRNSGLDRSSLQLLSIFDNYRNAHIYTVEIGK